MKQQFIPLLLVIVLFSCQAIEPKEKKVKINAIGPITLVIHGGAGTILKKNMTAEKEQAYQEKLQEALNAGYSILEKKGTSLEAVTAAIQIMENSPLFNAGKGAVFTNQGKNELDASIMDGNTGKAGAVAGITGIKNPILAALAVMDHSPHVMMSGRGAELFAIEQGLETEDSAYFHTDRRWKSLQRAKKREKKELTYLKEYPDYKFGTVGAVALDHQGNIAAGTSTGGMTNKKWGRVGDSPMVGAGNYANNKTCAISCTGSGEYFIRGVVAYDVSCLMEFKGLDLKAASEEVINKRILEIGGDVGLIGVDAEGNIAMPFNTEGMYRGCKSSDGTEEIAIYK